MPIFFADDLNNARRSSSYGAVMSGNRSSLISTGPVSGLTATAEGVGNKVVLFGARTGGDGIGGASILASDTFSAGGPTKRPAVQVGDPFAEKVLIECCLELFHDKLVEGIQDLVSRSKD